MTETNRNIAPNLTDREQEILRSIVNMYILHGSPVGSRKISKHIESLYQISPATARNIMADLEEMELIGHPHTSAGRVPTDKGYRYYVDYLMKIESLNQNEMDYFKALKGESSESEEVLKKASKLLGLLSHNLALVRIPKIKELKIKKIEIIKLSSTHILFVLALDSNIVRTLTVEAQFEVEDKFLHRITDYINEKVSGRNLSQIRENFSSIIHSYENSDSSLIRLFINSLDKILYSGSDDDKVLTSGTNNLLNYPEFEDISRVKSIIELVENKDVIIHLLDSLGEKGGDSDTKIIIGSEIEDKIFTDYSLIISNYKLGDAGGVIGLIGPKRMQYNRLLPLVDMVSKLLTEGN